MNQSVTPDMRPEQNHLLACLHAESRERLFPYLESVTLPLGEPIYESGETLRYVYFPVDCIVSLLNMTKNGESLEISVVGNEGIVGISVFLGADSAHGHAIIQSAGTCYRLLGQRLKDEFYRHGELLDLMLRYTQSLMTQMTQTAACNRHHSIDQQLCRWLLLSIDRLNGPELNISEELIANMLGVRREQVTEAVYKLQGLGIISYNRDEIRILDRPKLKDLCCECYEVVKRESERLLTYKPTGH